MPAAIAVRFDRVSFSYSLKSGQHEVLRDLSLSVAEGETVAVVGPTGCGKTTALHLAAGLDSLGADHIREGQVTVLGANPALLGERTRLSYVFQSPRLLPWRTVQENIALPLEIASRSDGREHVDLLMNRFGLHEHRGLHPFQLSAGLRQRVALARAIVLGPDLLLLDEPFSSVDQVTREDLDRYLMELQTERTMTLLVVTHNISQAVFLADRVLVFSERPASVVAQYDISFARPRSSALLRSPEFANLLGEIRSRWVGASGLRALPTSAP